MRLERGCGDAGAARLGGSSTGESGNEIDNEFLKTEATRPALQPADDGARRRQGAAYYSVVKRVARITGEGRDRSRGLYLIIH
jgi:hypothetical protein